MCRVLFRTSQSVLTPGFVWRIESRPMLPTSVLSSNPSTPVMPDTLLYAITRPGGKKGLEYKETLYYECAGVPEGELTEITDYYRAFSDLL